ncbi:Tn3 family transposase [Streptomyces sp. NPDC052236]|uniref:Tn3 family transposase n=1 Tax=Streptomyces sp. NPDC052236 TaxID=3365686 RepID=UPI001ABF0C77
MADESYRRRIARQLNKGENLHALRRELAYAGEGAVRRRHHEQQSEQMWCLTVATNAIVTWSTELLRPGGDRAASCRPAHRR